MRNLTSLNLINFNVLIFNKEAETVFMEHVLISVAFVLLSSVCNMKNLKFLDEMNVCVNKIRAVIVAQQYKSLPVTLTSYIDWSLGCFASNVVPY